MKAESRSFWHASASAVDSFINSVPGSVKSVTMVSTSEGKLLVTVLYEYINKDLIY